MSQAFIGGCARGAIRYRPQAVGYVVRGHAWDHLDPAVPKFDKLPPSA